MTALLLEAIALSYSTPDKKRRLIDNVNFQLGAGELLVVTGANGIGKSTLIKIILNEQMPAHGKVVLSTESVGYLPQLQNRMFHIPLKLSDVLHFEEGSSDVTSDALGIGLLFQRELKLNWNQASGGERQKTLLTQVFLSGSNLLLLDEPMNHLDAEARKALGSALGKYMDRTQAGVVVVCHETQLHSSILPTHRVLNLERYRV